MKLSTLEITNFRCFESLSVKLHSEVNVIVGANGAGKTSILDAVGIALHQLVAGAQGKSQQVQRTSGLRPTDILVAPGNEESLSRKSFVQFRATAKDFYPLNDYPNTTVDGSESVLEWTDHITFTPPATFRYAPQFSDGLSRISRYYTNIWSEIQSSDAGALIPLPMVAYYRARRRIAEMPALGNVFAANLSREEAFSGALDAGVNFTGMCQWFYLRENAELREKVDRPDGKIYEFADLRAVRQALCAVVEGVERIFFHGSPPKLKVHVSSDDGTANLLELAQLSDGYRNLLALIFDYARRLAQAHPNWPNPLEAPGILLIDELELHLHPRWQQSLIPNLRKVFPNTQLIVATHSPAVLTTVRRENILLLGSDHQFESIPEDVGTYGAESSRVLAEVFGAHVRPPGVETVEKLRQYLSLIESREHDTSHAKALRSELEADLGRSDPDLRRADIRIVQLKVLAKQ